MTFLDVYNYCDALISEAFEGIPMRYNFNETEWEYVRHSEKVQMLIIYPNRTNLYQSKLVRKPYLSIKAKVQEIL